MATPEQVAEVRLNINEPTTDTFEDEVIEGWIDAAESIESASAVGWHKKAAIYADLVDVSEAGASHSFSDLHKAALLMAASFESKADVIADPGAGRVRVRRIERS